MPFLRFSRDKRGYEITCLMHAFRRRGQSRPRILYCFRTPPNVRVGRAPLDEVAIRSIEELHPDVEFDWPRILRSSALESGEDMARADSTPRSRGKSRPAEEGRRTAGRQRSGQVGQQRPPVQPRSLPGQGTPDAGPSEDGERQTAAVRAADATPHGASPAAQAEGPPRGSTAAPDDDMSARAGEAENAPSAASAVGEAAATATVETWALAAEEASSLGQPDAGDREPGIEEAWRQRRALGGWEAGPSLPFDEVQERPLERVLAAEDIARLRARFAEIVAHLAERVQDPGKVEELRIEAERLNPDTWVTMGEVRRALEDYERVYHAIRLAIGPRRGGLARSRVDAAPGAPGDGEGRNRQHEGGRRGRGRRRRR